MVRAGGLSILVVDDDAGIRESIRFALEANGIAAVAVESGARALEVFSRAWFDGAIVDLMMRGITGADTVFSLRARAPDLPIVVIAGAPVQGGGGDLMRIASELPGVRVLGKPFKLAELLRAVRAFAAAPAH
jgi:CheY-like chemotaxis protein